MQTIGSVRNGSYLCSTFCGPRRCTLYMMDMAPTESRFWKRKAEWVCTRCLNFKL